MKAKIICIIVMTLLITTTLPALGKMTEKEIPASLVMDGNSLNHLSAPNNILSMSRGGIFFQLPFLSDVPSSSWGAPISDKDQAGGWIAYDDFWDISVPICDIHWWGLGGETTHIPGDPTGMVFNITFYEDDGAGKPGNVVCKYVDIAPTIVTTGIGYYHEPTDRYWPLYYFTDVTLEPCCEISEGWVSVQGQSYLDIGVGFGWEPSPNGNNICWQYSMSDNYWYKIFKDLSFILTDGEPADPDLECDGELSWTDVPAGGTVTGDFVVRNNGDSGSILHWKVDESSIPEWGDWTFSYNASVLTVDAGWLTVDVEVVAPGETNSEFTGELKLVNVIDPSDTCEIPVYLKTPRNKAINNPFLNWLHSHPNMFPLLQKVLQHLGV